MVTMANIPAKHKVQCKRNTSMAADSVDSWSCLPKNNIFSNTVVHTLYSWFNQKHCANCHSRNIIYGENNATRGAENNSIHYSALWHCMAGEWLCKDETSTCTYLAQVSFNKTPRPYQLQGAVVQLTRHSDLPVKDSKQSQNLSTASKRVSVASFK